MFTALDAAPERLDQHEQNFVQQIREHGWFGTHVAADDEGPGFSYTTGFWLKFRFPEVILFSMSRETGWRLSSMKPTLGGADGFMEMTVSSVSSLCFRIEAESFRGRWDRQRISELLNLI